MDKAGRGWRRSHAYTRLPDAWKPDETCNSQGGMTADPLAFFDTACSQQLWAATDCGTYEQECRQI